MSEAIMRCAACGNEETKIVTSDFVFNDCGIGVTIRDCEFVICACGNESLIIYSVERLFRAIARELMDKPMGQLTDAERSFINAYGEDINPIGDVLGRMIIEIDATLRLQRKRRLLLRVQRRLARISTPTAEQVEHLAMVRKMLKAPSKAMRRSYG